MKQEIIVGTRDSRLALWQAHWVVENLQRLNPDCSFKIVGMKTLGDNILDAALAKIGDKGLFTKELELAMLRGEIDLAVHSMKDMPTKLPEGLMIGAICEREYPGDVLISRKFTTLDELPQGAKIGTSSLRRTAQLLRYRPDFQIVNVRGNLTTRLRKLVEEDLGAIVLAYAGVYRLGLEDRIAQKIPFDICLPAVGQGSVGIEVREDDNKIRQLLSGIDHPASRAAITAERALMKRLEGGCQIPIGALGSVIKGQLSIEGIVASLDGKTAVRGSLTGPQEEASTIGEQLAEILLEKGAGEILSMVRQECENNA